MTQKQLWNLERLLCVVILIGMVFAVSSSGQMRLKNLDSSTTGAVFATTDDTGKKAPATRSISVPSELADQYAQAQATEQQALDVLQQTLAFKDYALAKQQREKVEISIKGEVGCRPSVGKLAFDPKGRLQTVQCADVKE